MSVNLRGNWNYPTTIWAGPGRIAELALACAKAGIERPLIVTDEGLAGAPMIKNALAALKNAALFGAVRGNPALSHVEAGLRIYREGNHDGVVAFGGGSALDVGKVSPCGISRTSATGGLAPTPPASRPSSRCRPPPAPARKWAGPASSLTKTLTRKRSSFTR